MTNNNEIIIDGVNVAECVFLDYKCHTMCEAFRVDKTGFHQGMCIQNPNCHYKQSQRKEQELQAEKQEHKNCSELFNVTNKALSNSIQEIKELKQKNEELENKIKELENENKNLNEKSFHQKCKISKLIEENSTREIVLKINQKQRQITPSLAKDLFNFEKNINKFYQYKQALADIKEIAEKLYNKETSTMRV